MKKSIISVVLVLAMALSMTTTVFAAGVNDWESEIDVVEGAAVVNGNSYSTLQEAVDAANGSTVKLLEDAETPVTTTGDVSLDLNGFTATVNAQNVTLTDSATDNGTVGGKIYGSFTVADADRVTEKNGIRYVVLDGSDEKGAYKTANAVRVKVRKINIRPSRVGMYYVTEVQFNKNVANAGATYGVALSVTNKPDSNFETDSDTMWTSFAVPTGADFRDNGTSSLVYDIMSVGTNGETNSTNATMNIYANAYVNVDGIPVPVMMENPDVNYSLQSVMQALDAKLGTELQAFAAGTGNLSATGSKTLSFFETWKDAMTQTGWNLTNLVAALAKKNQA